MQRGLDSARNEPLLDGPASLIEIRKLVYGEQNISDAEAGPQHAADSNVIARDDDDLPSD